MSASSSATIRPAVNAGRFYPSDPDELSLIVNGYLDEVPEDQILPHPPKALIVPHAGYPYSGPVAAYAYAQIRRRGIRRAIVIGPSHYRQLHGIGVYDGTAFATPLGIIAIDRSFNHALSTLVPTTALSVADEHVEHSVEVQMPFLKVALDEFQIVPLLMRHHTEEEISALSDALSELLRGDFSSPDTVIIASSDLYHGYSQTESREQDTRLETLVRAYDTEALNQAFAAQECMACGAAPILAAMEAARQLGASNVHVLARTNSAEVTHAARGGGYIVGYMAAAII